LLPFGDPLHLNWTAPVTRVQRVLGRLAALLAVALAPLPAVAGDRELEELGASSRRVIQRAIEAIGERDDVKALPALEALRDRRLRVDEDGRLYAVDPQTSEALSLTRGAGEPAGERRLRSPIINNRVRRVLLPVIGQLQLHSPDTAVRVEAARAIRKRPRPEARGAIERAHGLETDVAVKSVLSSVLAQLMLESDDPDARLKAIREIGAFGRLAMKGRIAKLLETDANGAFAEPDERIRIEAAAILNALERKELLYSSLANVFHGLSLGSVLLLAALGLAIVFGLMGVINMAHGEMLMLGAYLTYFLQTVFLEQLPAYIDWYLLGAVPLAFVFTALVGAALERTVIRFLYGRPLETLLATWGISLLLIQTVRIVFGAQNVAVANPAWLSGGYELIEGVVLPYSRIAVLAFSVAVVGLVALLLGRTSLGLQVRAVTQNRRMAASMGIPTARIDTWTFALGCGIAGLGGVALSQITNVGPELGAFYTVDSFMVVVLGGVGQIAGTVVGAMGLGVVNKLLEPLAGAVLGKIAVLAFVILFIQRRPQGLFAVKGRAAEA
jgi:urea transport system permease protein